MSEQQKRLFDFCLDLPRANYSAIGEIIARAALVDQLALEAIQQILRLDNKQARIVVQGMNTKPRLAVLNALAPHWVTDGVTRSEIVSVVKGARELNKLRDLLAHAPWAHKRGTQELYVYNASESNLRYMPKAEQHSAQSLRESAAKLRELAKRLKKIVRALEREQPPSPDKQLPRKPPHR